MGTRLEWTFLLVATLCITLMPSIYRGGASVPHAHGFFQFWITGPERAFDHHRLDHHAGEHDHDDHAAHAASEAGATTADSGVVENRAADEPRVSPLSVPGGIVSAIAMAVMALVALTSAAGTRWRYPARNFSLSGRTFSPEPPPPRHGAV